MEYPKLTATEWEWCYYRMVMHENGSNVDSTNGIINYCKKYNINPFFGQCYSVTQAIHELACDKELYYCVREKDGSGVYHWWLEMKKEYRNREEYKGKWFKYVVDGTGFQYGLVGKYDIKSPSSKYILYDWENSDNEEYEVMKKPLWYPHYKNKVSEMKEKLVLWKNTQKTLEDSIDEYKNTLKKEGKKDDNVNKPIDLTDFMS